MKQIYLSTLLLLFVSVTNSQDELLQGEWVLDSIFDYDILIEYPVNSTSINFVDDEITINSFCGEIYLSSYIVTSDTTIDIIDIQGPLATCPDDTQNFEILPYIVLGNSDAEPDELIYTVSETNGITNLNLYSEFIENGIPSGSSLFLTKVTTPNTSLIGSWYLDSIVIDDAIYNNIYNNESLFELEINASNGAENIYDFSGFGVCNAFGGTILPGQSHLTFTDLNFTLQDCDDTPSMIFEQLYYYSFLNDGQNYPFGFSFSITGENDNQILSITNPTNGNKAVYGKTPNTEILTRTWYLSRIEIPGNPTIEIPNTESPSITLTNEINPITFRNTAFGDGECNAFMSDYEVSLSNGDYIQLLDFSPTLAFCESDYESEYFNIIGFPPNNFCEFEIINNGTTLTVTDLLGARLVFGDEPLSISENDLSTTLVSLKNNPVNSKMNLSVGQTGSKLSYKLYSIEGKLVKEAVLNSESIYVDDLNSGLYFIRFFNNLNQEQTTKFIKQ
ncbi:T9SS type A sorting domain-containing protein [Psychroserpens mesophilus]|uniref:T9SS type A sorting domain-containing protein n=1 Tax=Psychroserpens mesophilus TaxID=325473 RepID=UPI00058EA530|nr:META domain-containing protein [Psychroserpens mesophilus]